MRALVLGCGSIGSRHARNLAALGVEVVVVDTDPVAAATLAASLGAAAVDREAAPPCELVVVATPSVSHVDDLRWALDHGSDVFVEKPVAVSRAGAAEARALAAAHPGRVVMVGCNLRFSEGYAAMVASREVAGAIAGVIAEYGWWLPAWRPTSDYRLQYSARRDLGGGIVLDAIHELDYVLALAGPAVAVSGACGTSGILDVDVEDFADISLRHVDGALSHIHIDYLRRVYTRNCTVIGSAAQVTWDVPRRVVEVVREPGAPPQLVAAEVDSDPNAQYVDEMRHLLSCMDTRAPTCNDVDRAAATLEVALTARDGSAP